MRFHRAGSDEFAVCDFCDRDGSEVRVTAIGDKGICKSCLRGLALYIRAELIELDDQIRASINRGVRP